MSYKIVNGKIVKKQRDAFDVAKRKFFRQHRPVIKRDDGMYHNISHSYYNKIDMNKNYIANKIAYNMLEEV